MSRASDTFKIGLFGEQRANAETVLNVYSLMKDEVQEAKGQLPEHYRKQPFKVQMRVEEAIKVYERAIRSILGEQKT
jgi:hypothetical protein